MIAGVPSIVLAIFGLLDLLAGLPRLPLPARRRRRVSGSRSSPPAIVMALLALPLVVGATREALAQLPARLREASYALGKTRATTIRRVLLPVDPPGHRQRRRARHGPDHRRHRDHHDPARRDAARTKPVGHARRRHAARHRLDADELRLLQLAGGRGQRAEKAYAAAFVLLMIVLVLNALVDAPDAAGGPGGDGRALRCALRRPWRRAGGSQWTR